MAPFDRHRARRRFGQNFLVDATVVRRIAAAVGAGADDHIVEIGPGKGALTEALLDSGATVDAIELDRDLAAGLAARHADEPRFRLHGSDALRFDFQALATDRPLRVVGNLPYNISTPLIFHLLETVDVLRDMHFMLQREVVERLAAGPGSKSYGRLGVMVQYHCAVLPLFEVPPAAFHPQPKVHSAVVRLVPHRDKPCTARDPALFARLVNTAFQQRRKTLRNALGSLVDEQVLHSLAISSKMRPDTLTVCDYVSISNALTDTGAE